MQSFFQGKFLRPYKYKMQSHGQIFCSKLLLNFDEADSIGRRRCHNNNTFQIWLELHKRMMMKIFSLVYSKQSFLYFSFRHFHPMYVYIQFWCPKGIESICHLSQMVAPRAKHIHSGHSRDVCRRNTQNYKDYLKIAALIETFLAFLVELKMTHFRIDPK